METRSDIALLSLMQEGDQGAFEIVVHRYRQRLYRQIYRRIGSEEDTKDILQNIYFTLWINRKSISIPESFGPYLSRSAHYQIVDYYLLSKKKAVLGEFLALLEEPLHWSTEETMVAADLKVDVDLQLAKLPKNVQEAFRLSRQDGLSIKQIAERMDLSEQTVKNYLSVALHALRVFLRKDSLTWLLIAYYYFF